MRKVILSAVAATFAVAATGFVIPAAAKDKAKVKTGDFTFKKTSDAATPKKAGDATGRIKIRGVTTRRDADTFTQR